MNCARCRQPVEENRKFCGKCGALTASRGRAGDEPTIVPVRVNDLLEGKWRLERKLGEGEHARGLIDLAKFNKRLGAT